MWATYDDACASSSAAGAHDRYALSFELEAAFDAEAFSRTHRALRGVIRGGTIALDATLKYDGDAGVKGAFDAIATSLRDDACCFVLFRAATWALWTWAPAGARDAEAYVAARDALRRDLGGEIRVPVAATWTARDEIALDPAVADDARPLGYQHLVEVEGRGGGGGGGGGEDAPGRDVPDPGPVRYAM